MKKPLKAYMPTGSSTNAHMTILFVDHPTRGKVKCKSFTVPDGSWWAEEIKEDDLWSEVKPGISTGFITGEIHNDKD